jgi:hypothetical protein
VDHVDAVYGNVVLGFNFGTGGSPITDTWTKVVSGPDTTDIHTANGYYGLAVSAPGQSISLSITLTDPVDKYNTNSINGDDEWITGSITIGWSPDLSQWGCLNGTYTFTTADLTPIGPLMIIAPLPAWCRSIMLRSSSASPQDIM